MITVLCYENPLPGVVRGVFSQSPRKAGEQVKLCLADKYWSFLKLGEIAAVHPDPKWPGVYRYDVKVLP